MTNEEARMTNDKRMSNNEILSEARLGPLIGSDRGMRFWYSERPEEVPHRLRPAPRACGLEDLLN